jgi:Metallo-peptidase family M12B Reprolysin-like
MITGFPLYERFLRFAEKSSVHLFLEFLKAPLNTAGSIVAGPLGSEPVPSGEVTRIPLLSIESAVEKHVIRLVCTALNHIYNLNRRTPLRRSLKMRSDKLAVAILILVLFGSLPFTTMETEVVTAQGAGGYFEGIVPIQGHYLRAINTYPGVTPDSDGDGELDKGCTWDDNGDGVGDQHVVRDPLILDLEANAFSLGDNIMISFKQSIYATTGDIFALHVYGLFSASKDLLREEYTYTSSSGEKWPMVGPLNRVPGAIDAALGGYVHGPQDDTNTWKQGKEVENDIPQDFRIGGYQETNGWKNYDTWSEDKVWFSTGFWIKIPPGAKFLFFEAAGGYWNVGDAGYCRVKVDKDTDYDAIPDSWEKNGIDFNWDGTVDLNLAGANYIKKDIYVEIDSMDGHIMRGDSIADVEQAFLNCPATVKNGPITLHGELDFSDTVPHAEYIKFPNDFNTLKNQYFGTQSQRNSFNSKYTLLAKKYTYHYCMFVHNYQYLDKNFWTRTTSSGMAELYGNDFIVSLGNWTNGVGTLDQQEGTFMHELGHNLGLRHGGADEINYKPNYMSIMNYLFQTKKTTFQRPLTYSSKKTPDLNEAALYETVGLYGANWDHSICSLDTPGVGYMPWVVNTSLPINWNYQNGIENASVQANINNFPRWGYNSFGSENLHGYDDWSNLFFYFAGSPSFAGGFENVDVADIEMTWEISQAIEKDMADVSGGPIGPVQIIDSNVPNQPSTQDTASGSQTQNPFFNIWNQAISFMQSNPIIVAIAIAAVVIVAAVSRVAKRKKRQKPE